MCLCGYWGVDARRPRCPPSLSHTHTHTLTHAHRGITDLVEKEDKKKAAALATSGAQAGESSGGQAKKRKKPKMSLGESFKFLATNRYLGCMAVLVVSYGLAINFTEVSVCVCARCGWVDDAAAAASSFSLPRFVPTIPMVFICVYMCRSVLSQFMSCLPLSSPFLLLAGDVEVAGEAALPGQAQVPAVHGCVHCGENAFGALRLCAFLSRPDVPAPCLLLPPSLTHTSLSQATTPP